jgi:L-lactate dehydrogenase complex protein LldG
MSRDAMLAQIRAAIGPSRPPDRHRQIAIDRRLDAPPRHLMPARALTPKGELAAQFMSCLEEQSASVIRIAGPAGIPAAIAAYLTRQGLPPRLRLGAEPFFSALPWAGAAIERLAEPARPAWPARAARPARPAWPADTAALSLAVAGAAETGTLVLVSGADNPTSLAFLPETHIVAICADTIVGSYEEAFAIVRTLCGRRAMPRSLNLVSGPSRTGDIGGRIVLGAHGPRRLAVIIYESSGDAARGS